MSWKVRTVVTCHSRGRTHPRRHAFAIEQYRWVAQLEGGIWPEHTWNLEVSEYQNLKTWWILMGWVGLGCSEWPKPGGWWILSWHQKRWSLGLFQKVWRSDSGSNKLVIWRAVTIESTVFDLLFGLFDLLFDLLWIESWVMNDDFGWIMMNCGSFLCCFSMVCVSRRCGRIGDVYLPRDHSTQKNRGFAFVRFFASWILFFPGEWVVDKGW